MADQITLAAATGRTTGSRESRRLRAQGKIPAVVYGADTDPTPVLVDWTELRAALTTEAGMNALITLQFDGDEKLTIVKDMQRDPLRRDVTHVDFITIDRNQALDVEVPITLEGVEDADHLKELVVDQTMFALPVSAKPGSIPYEFVVNVEALTLDEPIRAGDITLPEGVELNVDPEDAIVIASVPVVELPEPGEDEEGAEDGEGAEGEAAAADGDAEASDDAEDGGEDE